LVEPTQLRLQLRDPLGAALVRLLLRGLGAQRLELAGAALGALADLLGGLAGALQPQLDPVGRRPRALHARREPLALLGALRQRPLGDLAPGSDLAELQLRPAPLLARLRDGGVCLLELGAAGAHRLARQLPASLDRLALQP